MKCPVCAGLRRQLHAAREQLTDLRHELRLAEQAHGRTIRYAARLQEQVEAMGAKTVTEADLRRAAGEVA